VIAESAGSDLLYAWSAEPGIVVPIALAGLLYLRGATALWQHAGPSRGLRHWHAAAFAAGWTVLALALLSPLHELSESSFSAHMVQHELLMVIAAPLMVLGRPLVAFAWSLPERWRRGLARWTGAAPARIAGGTLGRPAVAWLLHAIAIWAWHAPRLYDAALRNAPLHALQHASFLGTALLFWWALIHTARRRYGVSVLYLFTTAVHTTALGAVLALATRPLYPGYAGTSAWGLSALEDQQLAGLIMWVPGSVVYLVAALALMLAWLRQSDRGAPAAETASRERVPLDAAVAAVQAAP
jgi:cytochrome c oxidase assembly factor CtaG